MLFTYFGVSYNIVKLKLAFAIFSLNMFLTYFLHLNSYLLSFLLNTISRAQLLCPSVTSTQKLKTHSQLTQSPFTGTDCLFSIGLQISGDFLFHIQLPFKPELDLGTVTNITIFPSVFSLQFLFTPRLPHFSMYIPLGIYLPIVGQKVTGQKVLHPDKK